MKKQMVFAVVAMAVLVIAAGSAYAYEYVNGAWVEGNPVVCPNYAGQAQTIWACPKSTPAQMGAGPGTCPAQANTCPSCSMMTIYPGPCNQIANASQCGAFCSAGNQPVGWPYGWCSDYWLRPNSNY